MILDFTRDTFFQLINSPDEYCRILGENLVKYAFWVNKLDFGRNLSKYIPIDLYGKFKTKDGNYVSAYKTSWEINLILLVLNLSTVLVTEILD